MTEPQLHRDLVVERVPIDSVREHPRNPRRGDVELIAGSVLAHRQYVPIVVQRSTRFILRGNHTHKGLKSLGATTIDIVLIDCSDAEAVEILLMDNKASDHGRYDDPILADLLREVDDLPRTGWTPDELDDILLRLTPTSLDALADALGEHDPEQVWPWLRMRLSPQTKARVESWWNGLPGGSDETKARALLAWWPSTATVPPIPEIPEPTAAAS